MAKRTNSRKIRKIRNGTVLDHLPAGSALNVLRILGIDTNWDTTVAVLMNVDSKSIGKKDLVKVEDMVLKKEETDKLSLIANDATINIIKEYEVKGKHHVSLPEKFIGILKCANPNCVTNKGEPTTSIFNVERKKPILLRCKFCDRILDMELIEEQL